MATINTEEDDVGDDDVVSPNKLAGKYLQGLLSKARARKIAKS